MNALNGKSIRIDAGILSFAIRISAGKAVIDLNDLGRYDARICAGIADLVGLALGKKDADSLFFSGKIKTYGDTSLAIELRNILENTDIGELKRKLGPIGEALWN